MKLLKIIGAITVLLLVTFVMGALAAEITAPIPQDAETRERILEKALVIAEGLEFPKAGIQPTPRWLAEELGIQQHPGLASDEPSLQAYKLPQQADILDYIPPVGTQQYNDCAAFAVGYYGISYWNFRELGEAGTTDPEKVGSSGYLYNQISGGVDGGALYLAYPFVVTRFSGCAFLADYAPGNYVDLPDIGIQEEALPQRTDTSYWFFVDVNYPEPGTDPVSLDVIESMKAHLANGIPVMVGIYDYASFEGLVGVEPGTVYYGPRSTGDAFRGFHALIIVGYYDDSVFPGGGCFRLRNSWSEYWGFGGDIWVTYEFIQNYALEAYDFNDLDGYSPSIYVVLEVGHPRRGDLDVDVKVDGNTVAWHSPWIFYYQDQRDDMEVVLDISDSVNSSTEMIELVVSDKVSRFRGNVLDAELVLGGEVIDFHFDTGKVIPDDGETVGVIYLEPGAPAAGGDGGGGGCALPVSGMLLPMLLVPVVFLVRKGRR